MNERRDPIEAWLSADVELLPPPQGAFDRVHRRARHRRAMKAVTAAAGAAVIIAAGVTVPQLSGLLKGNPTVPAKIIMTPSASPAVRPGTLAVPGPPFSTAGGGPAPAAGFRATSVTFVGSTLGAVLGQAGSCRAGPCTAMAGTHDYGSTWTEIGAPPAGPADGRSGVSQVRFLNQRIGWAYGPQLYATHDGGKSWRAIDTHGGRVIDLSTVGRRAFAVVGFGCTGDGSRYAAGCARFRLFSAAAAGNEWDAVAGAAGAGGATPGGLQLTSARGYLLVGTRLYTGQAGIRPWQRVTMASSAPRCLTGQATRPRLIAPGASELFLVCQDAGTSTLTLYRSDAQGSVWQRRGVVQATGTVQSLAVTPSGTLVLATTTGIYRSADARTWNPARVSAPAGGFSFIGMTTDTEGVAVAATPGPAVYITKDGGLTWRVRPIR